MWFRYVGAGDGTEREGDECRHLGYVFRLGEPFEVRDDDAFALSRFTGHRFYAPAEPERKKPGWPKGKPRKVQEP